MKIFVKNLNKGWQIVRNVIKRKQQFGNENKCSLIVKRYVVRTKLKKRECSYESRNGRNLQQKIWRN